MELGRIGKYLIDNLILKYHTVILSNFRKTRTKDRIVSYRIVSYRIVSYRIVSYHISYIKYYKVRFFNFYS